MRVSLRYASSRASGGRSRVELHQCLPQSTFQHNVAVFGIGSLGRRLAGRDVGAVEDRITQLLEPGEGGVFDGGFAKRPNRHRQSLK